MDPLWVACVQAGGTPRSRQGSSPSHLARSPSHLCALSTSHKVSASFFAGVLGGAAGRDRHGSRSGGELCCRFSQGPGARQSSISIASNRMPSVRVPKAASIHTTSGSPQVGERLSSRYLARLCLADGGIAPDVARSQLCAASVTHDKFWGWLRSARTSCEARS